MDASFNIATRNLPVGLQRALKAASIGTHIVRVEAGTLAVPYGCSGAGTRAFCALVTDVEQDVSAAIFHVGSWGGPNPFSKPIGAGAWDPDYARDPQPIPERGAIITGTVGSYATVRVRPLTLLRMTGVTPEPAMATVIADADIAEHPEILALVGEAIAATRPSTTDDERYVLKVYSGIKGGYRKEYLEVVDYTPLVDALVARGLLKRNKAGAVQITPEGKNACADGASVGQEFYERRNAKRYARGAS